MPNHTRHNGLSAIILTIDETEYIIEHVVASTLGDKLEGLAKSYGMFTIINLYIDTFYSEW
jgi:hypothetical protein